jgi:hypothetical protein
MYSRYIIWENYYPIKIPVKYIILAFAFCAGIAAAGTFICYTLIEIQDLKIINKEEET